VLIFTSAEIEKVASRNGFGAGASGLLGGMGGGIAQAYATMGEPQQEGPCAAPALIIVQASAPA
jgi:hypothetical protein